MKNKIDHFAIGADSLAQGVEYLKSTLGVEVPTGGKHAAMSTHNCVCQSGNESFLEIIAIDPEAPEPGRTRWFTLDNPRTQSKLSVNPSPLCWVVGTDNLDAVIEASPVDLGEVVLFTRGERSWRLTVPKDGSLPENGLLPAFIEWSPGAHPSAGMQDLGIALNEVKLSHPEPETLLATLKVLGVDHLATVEQGAQPMLELVINAPDGTSVSLKSE
jgi:hypothetical protein